MRPGFIYHLLCISQFELQRLFTTRKGLLYLLTFAVVWYFILLYPVRFSSDLINRSQGGMRGSRFFEFIGFDSLFHWKIPELGVYWHFSLFIFPLLSIMSASDQTCSDRVRGTLRFLMLRVSRDSLFFGRFTGIMMTQALLIMASLLTTLVLVIYRDSSLLPIAINSALVIAVNLILVVSPFTAMMAALSATVKSARLATVWAILIWSFLAGIISILSSYLPVLDGLKLLIPGYQMPDLSQLSEWQTLRLAHIPLLQTVVLLTIGRWIMQRQAL